MQTCHLQQQLSQHDQQVQARDIVGRGPQSRPARLQHGAFICQPVCLAKHWALSSKQPVDDCTHCRSWVGPTLTSVIARWISSMML